MTNPTLRRGARPAPRSMLAAAKPYAPFGGPPATYIVRPQKISMWGNDVHGDCVTAEEAFAKACHDPELFISDNEVISWATKHGVLQGAYLPDVLTWMQTDGFDDSGNSYDDGPHFSVDWTNAATLRSAIAVGPVKLGIAADQIETAYWSTDGKSGWVATGFHADGNEDHCVALCGYGSLSWLAQQLGTTLPNGVNGSSAGYALFTWNSIRIIDAPSMAAITHEAWLRNPTTITKSDTGWSGWAALGGVLSSDPVVASNADGRLEAFARGSDNAVCHIWQTAPNGNWSGWAGLGGVLTSNIAVGSNADGRLEAFGRGTDNALYHIWQA